MNLIIDAKKGKTVKPEMEQVEKEKQEYKLIGKFIRTRGLKLFSYDPVKNEMIEMKVRKQNTLRFVSQNGELVPLDTGFEEVSVDSRNVYFEALNLKSAQNRVKKYKSGNIRELCNLRKYDPEKSIKLW